MLPWNYGFHWNIGTVIFMGAFYTVLVVVVTTLISAALRSRRAMRTGAAEDVRWHADFHDLPGRDRPCRHQLTGELEHRDCQNSFDCRQCDTHRTLLEQRPPSKSGDKTHEGFGMTFPLDRMYHRGHTWVRREPKGAVTIGLDDFGRCLFGKPDFVELPRKGQRIRLNGTAWRMRKGKLDQRVVSPVSGIVLETGGPDGEWYLKVMPAHPDLRHLLEGIEVQPWVAGEVERLQMALSAAGAPPDPDGRTDVAAVAAACPAACWETACGTMFLRP